MRGPVGSGRRPVDPDEDYSRLVQQAELDLSGRISRHESSDVLIHPSARVKNDDQEPLVKGIVRRPTQKISSEDEERDLEEVDKLLREWTSVYDSD